jgi:hypothetical protein
MGCGASVGIFLMSDERIWQEGATEKELAEVAVLDDQIAVLASYRAEITYKRLRITNRACQRARYRRMTKKDVDITAKQ